MSTTATTAKALSPALLFAGKWSGHGTVYAKSTGTMAATYLESATLDVTRQTPDFVVYRMHQDTRHADTNKPMHTETGFCKIIFATGHCTMQQAHPFPSGFVSELSDGQLSEDGVLTLVARDFQRANPDTDNNDSSSKQVTGFKRVYRLMDDNHRLVYDQYLSSGGSDLFHHLHCEMTKDDDGNS